MPLLPWSLPLAGLAVISVCMLLTWRRQRRTGNAGTVDVVWTFALGALALGYAVLGDGWWLRRAAVAGMVAWWSARLGWHLVQRMGREKEDGRYAQLREDLGERFDAWSLVFFQIQALLAVGLSLVFLALCLATEPGWRLWDSAGVLLWLVAQAGEALADAQLDRWRRDPQNRGKTCRSGLWRYSRHPNYFFEWLHWVAYALMATGLPYGGLTWLAPLVMLVLVRQVTGIPPTEKQSLRSRPEDYRRYQQETNAFFPGPWRRVEAQG